MAAYAEIVEIVALDRATPDTVLTVEVKIKNTYSSTIGIMVGGALEYGVSPWPRIVFLSDQANVPAGETQSFQGLFTMPSSSVVIHAYSYYYGTDGYWHFDDEKTKRVSLAELVSAFSQFEIRDYSVV